MRRTDGGRPLRRRDVELTERQRQVLRLIAAGKTNAEIGEALNISLDGAKWHVSEILARLDVATREEAAEWWRERERPLARLGATLRVLLPGAGWLKVGAATVGLVTLSAATIVVLVALRQGGANEPPQPTRTTPTPMATPSPTATASEAAGRTPTATTPSVTTRLPAWSQQLPPLVQQVAEAVTDGDRSAILTLLHFRSPFGKPYIGFLTACQGGGGLTSADDVAEHLLEISARHGALSEAVRANEEVQTLNLVYFLIFTLADPAENRAVVVDDQGVIMLFQGCDPTADSFAGNGNATVWR
jgi:DNA-binding CsgD family transcriptional regulator